MITHSTLKTGKGTWLLSIILGWLSLALGLYIAALVGAMLEEAGISSIVVQLVKGSIISIIVLSIVCIVQTKMLQRPWKDIFGNSSLQGIIHFIIGVCLALGLAILGFILASWQGWIHITQWHITPELIGSIALNIMFAFLYEALPEETALRGFAYSTMRLKFSAFLSFLG